MSVYQSFMAEEGQNLIEFQCTGFCLRGYFLSPWLPAFLKYVSFKKSLWKIIFFF